MSAANNYRVHRDLLEQAAKDRNLSVVTLGSDFYSIEGVLFNNAVPETTSVVAKRLCDDKAVTRLWLQRLGYPIPKGVEFVLPPSSASFLFNELTVRNELKAPYVVKPARLSGGRGVFMNVNTQDDFDAYIAYAQSMFERGWEHFLLEEQCQGKDHRFFLIDEQIAAVCERRPPHVKGDGTHSILDLLTAKNVERLKNPYTCDKLLSLDNSVIDGSRVPKDGEYVELSSVANVAQGGEAIDVTDNVNPAWETYLQPLLNTLTLLHCGVDIMIDDVSKAPDETPHTFLEINAVPDIAMHHYPTEGESRHVADMLLQALI